MSVLLLPPRLAVVTASLSLQACSLYVSVSPVVCWTCHCLPAPHLANAWLVAAPTHAHAHVRALPHTVLCCPGQGSGSAQGTSL